MKSSKSNLFLLELIISILFFSIASAACIQLFVKAHLLDDKTKEQNFAVTWSQNLAELWQFSAGDINIVYKQLSGDYDITDGSVILSDNSQSLKLSFDKEFSLSDSQIVYHAILSDCGYDSSTQLLNAEISFTKGSETFYTLPLMYHPPAERGVRP